MHTDRIPQKTRTAVANRLRRATGQLQAVARTLEEGGDCVAVVRQLTAGSNAVQRAGIVLLSAGLVECLSDPRDDDLPPDEFQKLFMQFT